MTVRSEVDCGKLEMPASPIYYNMITAPNMLMIRIQQRQPVGKTFWRRKNKICYSAVW